MHGEMQVKAYELCIGDPVRVACRVFDPSYVIAHMFEFGGYDVPSLPAGSVGKVVTTEWAVYYGTPVTLMVLVDFGRFQQWVGAGTLSPA